MERISSAELPSEGRAVIFGGGHITLPLIPILKSVGFRVTVMDNDPAYANTERFPTADEVICGDFLHIGDYVTLGEGDYAVIMTNGHEFDYPVQAQVLRFPTSYVGVLGHHLKFPEIHARLREEGIAQEAIDAIHAPIGVPIRSMTSEEIAVSIAAELIDCRAANRSGKDEACPMHG